MVKKKKSDKKKIERRDIGIETEKEEKEEQKRVNDEWRRIEKMRMKEERKAKKEWR